MFLKINSSLPIHIIYQERVRVSRVLEKYMLKKNNDIKFHYIYDNKIKSQCTKEELNIYLKYLDEHLYIYPKINNFPDSIRDKIKYYKI